MAEMIEGVWEDLIARRDLSGRRVRVIILDENQEDPWLKSLQGWADSHQPLGHPVDDSREGIYSGTVDDPR